MEHETAPATSDVVASAFVRGDHAVVAAYFRENAGVLLAMARRVALSTMDPEDLLADAIASLLAQWSKGVRTQKHINAYIVQSMRNRVKDELKSPRSRTHALELVEDSPAEPSPLLHRAELGNEIALVRKALARLPADQQAVLRETVVNGRKPGELEDVLGRPATAITALGVRAKQSLRRALLQVLISEGTEECQRAVRHVPNPVTQDLAAVDARGRPTHFANCEHCRRSWARFSALPSALGLTVLLVLGDALGAPAPAASAAEDVREEPASRPKRTRNVLLLGAGVIALAAATFTTLFPLNVHSSGPNADVEVFREPVGDARVNYSVDLRVHADVWQPKQATFSGPHAIGAIEPPSGWTCTIADTRAVCKAVADESSLAGFIVEYLGEVTVPAFELQVVAVTSDGATVTADATGAGVD
ncbi:MAG: RNA polymerase sigma factor [Actinomycetota bacterium]